MQGESNVKNIRDWLLRELYFAFLEARKHKLKTTDEHRFELNAMENLAQLRDDILNKVYKPSAGKAFIIYDPVPREIFAAPFRDRVVHHFIYSQVADWWDRRFIYDSYSCRKNKGTLFAVKRLQKQIRKVSKNGERKAFVIKRDLAGYFMSLPHDAIFERACWGVDRQFDGVEWMKDLLKYLWKEIIYDDPTANVHIQGDVREWNILPDNKSLFCQPPGQGIVIGNLSSQLLSNIYLDLLDRYITMELGYKHYGRYVDDFYIIVPFEDRGKALNDIDIKVKEFLRKELKLNLHPNKKYSQETSHGVPFLGTIVSEKTIMPSKRFKNHFYHAVMEYTMGFNRDESIISYLGYLKHVNGKKLAKRIFELNGFDYSF